MTEVRFEVPDAPGAAVSVRRGDLSLAGYVAEGDTLELDGGPLVATASLPDGSERSRNVTIDGASKTQLVTLAAPERAQRVRYRDDRTLDYYLWYEREVGESLSHSLEVGLEQSAVFLHPRWSGALLTQRRALVFDAAGVTLTLSGDAPRGLATRPTRRDQVGVQVVAQPESVNVLTPANADTELRVLPDGPRVALRVDDPTLASSLLFLRRGQIAEAAVVFAKLARRLDTIGPASAVLAGHVALATGMPLPAVDAPDGGVPHADELVLKAELCARESRHDDASELLSALLWSGPPSLTLALSAAVGRLRLYAQAGGLASAQLSQVRRLLAPIAAAADPTAVLVTFGGDDPHRPQPLTWPKRRLHDDVEFLEPGWVL